MSKQKNRVSPKTNPGNVLAKVKTFSLHPYENRKVIEHFYSSLNTPVSLACYMLYKYEEHDQLVSKEINPLHYNDAVKFRDDFASVSLLRKHGTLKTSFDKKERALSAFKEAENTCKSTNQRLKTYLAKAEIPPRCEWLLHAAIRKIDKILGVFPIDELLDSCNWGPGVTTSVKGSDTSASHKFDDDHSITRDLYHLFSDIGKAAYPLWDAWSKPVFEVGNVIITVPKNAKVDRTIAIEPGLNSWVQKGIGSIIRRRLRRAGYNLNSDLKNQRGAYLGSLNGSTLSTVDFTAASDTISLELVRLLLPDRWFKVLDAARSKYYLLEGKPHLTHKFSSMGNGFTFELESLIFLAFGLAVCELNCLNDQAVSIFGDDLIIPSKGFADLDRICTFTGFSINYQKTFSDGQFRESCGSYFFNGLDVKPVFLKQDLINIKDLYRFLNAIRILSHRRNSHYGCDIRLRSLWSFTLHRIPSNLRFFGPVSGGDSVIHENINREKVRSPLFGHEGFLYSGLPEVPLSIEKSSHGLLLQRLLLASKDRAFYNSVPLRARTRIVFKKSMFVCRWYELGPWF